MHKKQKTIGVLAFQGDVIEHQIIIESLGHRFKPVRAKADLQKIDALILPGGESTTIGFFLQTSGLGELLKQKVKQGIPIWGTCAGAIVLAKKIVSEVVPPHFELMDITVERNAYGKQIDSFYADLSLPKIGIKGLKAAFIRAPIIQKVSEHVQILAKYQERIIFVQQNKLLASTFHPELRGDSRLHQYFISLCS